MSRQEGHTNDSWGDQLPQRLDSTLMQSSEEAWRCLNESSKKHTSFRSKRSVDQLTPSQLHRKRTNDREAQRANRQRTRNHISNLERDISDLRTAHDKTSKMLVVSQEHNNKLEEENAHLRKANAGYAGATVAYSLSPTSTNDSRQDHVHNGTDSNDDSNDHVNMYSSCGRPIFHTDLSSPDAYWAPPYQQPIYGQFPIAGGGGLPVIGAHVALHHPETGHPASAYNCVPTTHGACTCKRSRRRPNEIDRLYQCGWQGCEKAYGTLKHLNAHVIMQSHGSKRFPEEFRDIRKKWGEKKKRESAHNTPFSPVGLGFSTFGPSDSRQLPAIPAPACGTNIITGGEVSATDAGLCLGTMQQSGERSSAMYGADRPLQSFYGTDEYGNIQWHY